jgi:hypothetical protein
VFESAGIRGLLASDSTVNEYVEMPKPIGGWELDLIELQVSALALS